MALNITYAAPSVAPIGSKITITENGQYNVTDYAVADINVSGGGGETWETVFEGSVTTHDDDGEIFGIIENLTLNGNSIRVTFNGAVYELPKTEHGYGAENDSGIDFSTYPLFIATGGGLDSCTLWTLTAGTYTLKIEEQESGGGESDFSTAEVTINATETPINYGGIYDFVCIDDMSNIKVLQTITYDDAHRDALTFNTILYKGKYVVTGMSIDSLQGSATMEEEEDLFIITITGDCTITIS